MTRSISLTISAVLVFSCGLFAQDAAAQVPSATIATVNTEAITQADLDRVRSARADTGLGSVLVDLIDERLLVQRGQTLGYQVSDQEYQAILEDLKRENKIASDDELESALKKSSLTAAQLRTNVQRSVIASRVLQTEGMAQVTDDDAQRYFEAHLDEFPLQTFDAAKSDVITRLKADRTTQTLLAKPYLQSLRRGAAIVWRQLDLQQAYEQASR
jgi:parvulin-like peptidyl-prolyl isomerase